jgi:sec-independent protein translocase protein TatB
MEKLLLIGVVALFLIGPDRLPAYSAQLARLVRNLRDMASGAKVRMKDELGPDFDDMEWKKLDPRQYDPRRIIRDALKEDPLEPSAGPDSSTTSVKTPAENSPPRARSELVAHTPAPFDVDMP